jgi:hypothetical protein
MTSRRTNNSYANQGPPMQINMPRLRHGNLELAANLSDDRPNKTPLLLERMHIPKKQINLKNPSKHARSALSEGRGKEVVMGGPDGGSSGPYAPAAEVPGVFRRT